MCFIRLRHSSVYNEGVHLCVLFLFVMVSSK